MAQLTRVLYRNLKLTSREKLLVLEIERDKIDTASAFVNYISEEYGFSKSSVWYNLNRLKELGVVEFANRDEIGKPLCLTKGGLGKLDELGEERSKVISLFSPTPWQKARGAYGDVSANVSAPRVEDYRDGVFNGLLPG